MAAAVQAWLWERASMNAGRERAGSVDLETAPSSSGLSEHRRDAEIIREVVLGVEWFLAAHPEVSLSLEDKSVLIVTLFRTIKEDSRNGV